jgi:hypothetical protein
MNKVILISALSLLVAFSGFAQTKPLKGPKYKNAKPSEKYDGNSSVLMKENPNQFQGPEYKNFNPNNYEIEVLDSNKIEKSDVNLVVSTENKVYETEETKEVIIYRRIDTKDMKGKNTKGLKGPAYKNYKQ